MIDSVTLRPAPSPEGACLPLLTAAALAAMEKEGGPVFPRPSQAHILEGSPVSLPVGSILGGEAGLRFQVAGRVFLPGVPQPCPVLRTLTAWPPAATAAETADWSAPLALPVRRTGYAVACVTLSDKGYAGERQDKSGPALLELLRTALPLCHEQRFLLPDDPAALRALVLELATGQGYDGIVSTGGTGLSPRDLTPEALLPVLSRRLPGFEQRMMEESLRKTPHAALSRALAGTVGTCLVLALPGSVKAATENLSAVLPALPHALEKLAGDPSDCGG